MTYEIYRYIFIGGAALSIIMLIVSVLLFIFLHIPTVIGDLNGSNARKAIETIRNQNVDSGEKTYKSSHVNQQRGKLTDKISSSGQLIQRPSDSMGGAMATAKLDTQKLAQEEELSGETTVLGTGGETTLLESGGETTLLEAGGGIIQPESMQINGIEVEFEITYIHTDEIIS